MENNNDDEKRQHLRLPRPYKVVAKELAFPIAKDPLIESTLYDISKGGICIESSSPIEIGSRMHVTVHVPLLNKYTNYFYKVYENDAEQYFQAIADVTWVKASGGVYLIGLKFVNVDAEIIKGIDKLIKKAFKDLEKA